jgi:hypothetical protein
MNTVEKSPECGRRYQNMYQFMLKTAPLYMCYTEAVALVKVYSNELNCTDAF